MLEKHPKGSEMSDVAVARSIIDDTFNIERTGRSRVIVLVFDAVKRIEKQLSSVAPEVLRQRPRQWTERRVRSIVDREAARVEYAEFIEDMLHTIARPAGADLLDAISDLKVDRGIKFKSGLNQANGTVKLTYEEEDATGGGGIVSIPQEIVIVCPVFQGTDPIQITAKLRYRLDPGWLRTGEIFKGRSIGAQGRARDRQKGGIGMQSYRETRALERRRQGVVASLKRALRGVKKSERKAAIERAAKGRAQ